MNVSRRLGLLVAMLAAPIAVNSLHGCGGGDGPAATGALIDGSAQGVGSDAGIVPIAETTAAQDIIKSIQSTFLLRDYDVRHVTKRAPGAPADASATSPPVASVAPSGAPAAASTDPAIVPPPAAAPPAAPPRTAGTIPVISKTDIEGFVRKADHLVPARAPSPRVAVEIPDRASGAWRVADSTSSTAVTVRLRHAHDVPAAIGRHHVVFANGYGDGHHIVHRVTSTAAEDYVVFPEAPSSAVLTYDIQLESNIHGLRLVANTLELLDADGVPRLRLAPPYVVDHEGTKHVASVAVEGCRVDTDPRPPWQRKPTAPSADHCEVRVSWSNEPVKYPAIVDPQWSSTGSMTTPRKLALSAVIAAGGAPYGMAGLVLVAGGYNGAVLSSAELYDPVRGVWSPTGTMHDARFVGAAVPHPDGRVFVMGGLSYTGQWSLTGAEVYSLVDGNFYSLPPMNQGRDQFVAAIVNGQLSVVGGRSYSCGWSYVYNQGWTWICSATALASGEVYNQTTNAWSTSSFLSLATARWAASGTVLADGSLLVAGGTADDNTAIATSEQYVCTASWSYIYCYFKTPVNMPSGGRFWHTATPFANGAKVLVASGFLGWGFASTTADIFDSATSSWTPTSGITQARARHGAALLGNGTIGIFGGAAPPWQMETATAELYDPAVGWRSANVSTLQTQRTEFMTAALSNGLVLVAGGDSGNGNYVASSELYNWCNDVDISSHNLCIVDSCDPVTGIHHVPVPIDTSNLCKIGTCDPGTGIVSYAPVTLTNTACSSQTCDPIAGVRTVLAGATTPCPGTSSCVTSTCDGSGACVARSNLAAGTACTAPGHDFCDWGSPTCNGSGACIAGTPPVTGASADGCLTSSCDSVLGITYSPTTPAPAGCVAPVSVTPDKTVPANVAQSASFLYTGPNPVQIVPDSTKFDPPTIGIVRGRVLALVGTVNTPQQGVRVSVLNHPEFGYTLTRADGWFDLAVNGGPTYVLRYTSANYLEVQRNASSIWQDYTIIDDVVLTRKDPTSASIALGGGFKTLVGSPVVDADGSRQAVVMFPAGTTAWITYDDGSRNPLSGNLTVRATEYTVNNGPSASNGRLAMPGDLPPTSAFTYAVELSADEVDTVAATNSHVTGVSFNQNVILYVDNFVGGGQGLPTTVQGKPMDVPSGYYNRQTGQWWTAPNTNQARGRVIKIVADNNNVKGVDWNGDGINDDDSVFAPPLVAGERAELLARYAVGKTLWRMPTTHFTPWDLNWGGYLPADAGPPNTDDPSADAPLDDPCTKSGSIIECENQILAEELPIAGTPFSLRYQSERTRGRQAIIRVPITSGTAPPNSLLGVEVYVDVAGKRLGPYVIMNSPRIALNTTLLLDWDRTDAYGRYVQGSAHAYVYVGYLYALTYSPTANFGDYGSGVDTVINRQQQTATIWRRSVLTVGAFDNAALGFGGWSLSAQHVYEPSTGVFYGGDGARRNVKNGFPVVANAFTPFSLQSQVSISDIAVAPDGSIFVSDDANKRIYKFDRTGHPLPYAVTGAPAVTALTVAPDGMGNADGSAPLYYGQRSSNGPPVIKVVDSNGTTKELAPFTNLVVQPFAIRVARDGAVFVADFGSSRVYRATPNLLAANVPGTAQVVAGGGMGYAEGALATSVAVTPFGLEVSPDGDVYVRTATHVFRIGVDGKIHNFAGNDSPNPPVDGVLATQSSLTTAAHSMGLALGRDGTLYINEFQKIRAIGAGGYITTFAGTNNSGDNGDGPAAQQNFGGGGINGLQVSPDGSVYVGDQSVRRVRKVSPTLPTYGSATAPIVVPSDRRPEVYSFSPSGQHQTTQDSLTGVTTAVLAYTNGLLTSITDPRNNLKTTIDRSTPGQIVIKAPFNQTTTLTLDSNGYLSTVKNFNNEQVVLHHGATGLLQTLTDPNDALNGQTNLHTHRFTWTPDGLLSSDTDPFGVSTTLSSIFTARGLSVALTSAQGHVTRHTVTRTPEGNVSRTVTTPSGAISTYVRKPDETRTTSAADGTVTTVRMASDPRFGSLVPYETSRTTTMGTVAFTRNEQRSATWSVSPPPAPGGNPFGAATATTAVKLNNAIGSWISTFDFAQRTLTTTSPTFSVSAPAGRRTVATLDLQDRVTTVVADGFATVNRYFDGLGRLDHVTVGDRTVQYAYDPATGFLLSVTNPLQQTMTITARDPVGRPTSITLPDGTSKLKLGYDLNGNVTSVTVPKNLSHGFTPTNNDLLQTYTPPTIGGTSTSYTYNKEPQVTSLLRPDGTVRFDYDFFGRSQQVTHPDLPDTNIPPPTKINTTYKQGTDLVETVTTSDGTIFTLGYVGSLLSTTTWTAGLPTNAQHVLQRTYYPQQGAFSLGVDTQSPVAWTYDEDGVLSSAGQMTVQRDPTTGLIGTTTLGSVSDSMFYNAFGEPASYAATAGGQPLYSVSYGTRDGLGRITSKTETIRQAGSTASDNINTYYKYDDVAHNAMGRLWRVCADSACSSIIAEYTYDLNGNRLSQTGSAGSYAGVYDDQDRMSSYGSTTYGYTTNGDLRTRTANGQLTTYGYDLLGGLRSVTRPGMSQPDITYVIDGAGRRIGKKNGSSFTQAFLYQDGIRPFAELDATNSVSRIFIYGTKSHSPDYVLYPNHAGPTALYRIISDQVGSPRLVVNTSSGKVVHRIDYDAFGVATETFDLSSPDNTYTAIPFGFAAGLYDRETGLVRFGARDYDPNYGRWLTKDPSRFRGGRNFYAYANSDPVNFVDIDGLDAIRVNFVGTDNTGYSWGHTGVVLVDPQSGASTYYDFHPGGEFLGPGNVAATELEPRIEFDASGSPTTQSINQVLGALREMSNGRATYGEYIRGVDVSTATVFANQSIASPPRYNALLNNCRDFASDLISHGGGHGQFLQGPTVEYLMTAKPMSLSW